MKSFTNKNHFNLYDHNEEGLKERLEEMPYPLNAAVFICKMLEGIYVNCDHPNFFIENRCGG